MDNKIILELIKKNLEEINLLVDDLYKGQKYNQLLIEITTAKAKILFQELTLLTPTKVSVTIPEVLYDTLEVIEQQEKKIIEKEEVINHNNISISVEVEVEQKVPETEVIIEDLNNNIAKVSEPSENVAEVQEKKVFGEKFQKEPSLHDRLSVLQNTEPKIKAKPISSLKTAIGLNDRFLFTRELFNNNSSEFDTSVERIDQMNSFLEVIEYLEQNFKWTKNATSLKFMELVKRRFEN